MFEIENNREEFMQYDRGQRLIMDGVQAGLEVHFAHPEEEALIRLTYQDGDHIVVDVPDKSLKASGRLFAYTYPISGDEAHTELKAVFLIRGREKPEDYIDSEEEIRTWQELEKRIQELENSGGSGGTGSLVVTDDGNGNVTISMKGGE